MFVKEPDCTYIFKHINVSHACKNRCMEAPWSSWDSFGVCIQLFSSIRRQPFSVFISITCSPHFISLGLRGPQSYMQCTRSNYFRQHADSLHHRSSFLKLLDWPPRCLWTSYFSPFPSCFSFQVSMSCNCFVFSTIAISIHAQHMPYPFPSSAQCINDIFSLLLHYHFNELSPNLFLQNGNK